MAKLFQAVYSGILYGSIYGLMAIGLTLIWGSLRMLNMAHGALYVVGAFLAWTALQMLFAACLATSPRLDAQASGGPVEVNGIAAKVNGRVLFTEKGPQQRQTVSVVPA